MLEKCLEEYEKELENEKQSLNTFNTVSASASNPIGSSSPSPEESMSSLETRAWGVRQVPSLPLQFGGVEEVLGATSVLLAPLR